MGVIYEPFGGGGSGTVTSDNDFPSNIVSGQPGPPRWSPYSIQATPFQSPWAMIQPRQAQLNDGLQGLLFQQNGQANPLYIVITLMPCMTLVSQVNNRTQFSQCTFVDELNPAGANEAGIAVLIDITAQSGLSTWYAIAFGGGNVAPVLVRKAGLVGVALIAAIAGGAPVLGDIYRLSATPAAGATVLKVTKNGTLLHTFTDGASSLLTGVPGLYGASMSGTGQIQIRTWSGGLGL